jgi:hypothetical protein
VAQNDSSNGLNRRGFLAVAAASGAGIASAAEAGDKPSGGDTSFGQCPADEPLHDAWERFCDQLKAAGALVFKGPNPPTALHRVDGFRYLTQNLSQAFDLALETKNTKYPALELFCSPTRKLGSDNADCIYQQVWIDGQSVYKIAGTKGSARMFNIAVQGPRRADAYGKAQSRPLMDPFGDAPETNIFGSQLITDWDGSFELYIGGEKQGQNWLPTTPGSRKLFIRQYFDSWEENPAAFSIERVGMDTPRPIPTPDEMIEAMRWAGQFCYDCVDYWPDWVWESGTVPPDAINRFAAPEYLAAVHGTSKDSVDSRRGRLATSMRWKFANDEALIVEFDDYDGFWMFTNEGVFGDSMDYLYRPVSYSTSRTAVDPDGKVRLVMCAADPGYANWIDNQGYITGQLTFRNVMSRHAPELRTKMVKFADLANHMPPNSSRATREDRIAAMHARFDAIRRRYHI